MAQVAREQGLSFDSVRQIKEQGLRRLRMGKAKRELLEKFDIAEAGLFRGGLNNYREHDFVSLFSKKKIECRVKYESQHTAKEREIEEKLQKIKEWEAE